MYHVYVEYSLLTVLILICSSVAGTCPPGFFHHEESCYVLLPIPANWSDAMHLCEIFGASLAVVENAHEDLFLKGLLGRRIGTLSTPEVWLGGTDMLNEGEWLWAKTFQPIIYTRWAPNEPNNGANQDQHCLGMEKDNDFKWDDNTCSRLAIPLCERPIDLPWGKDVVQPNQIVG